MAEIVIEVVLVGLIILVLWDYFKSRIKVDKIQEKQEYMRNSIGDERFLPAKVHTEVTQWEQECMGSNYAHDKLRQSAEEAMRIKERNRCEMNGKVKRNSQNGRKVIGDVMGIICELVDAFKG